MCLLNIYCLLYSGHYCEVLGVEVATVPVCLITALVSHCRGNSSRALSVTVKNLPVLTFDLVVRLIAVEE